LAGAGLVVWWLLPASVTDAFLGDMQQGIEMFFISGIMLVIGGVWVVMYNSDLVLRSIVAVVGRFRGLPPVLKTAVAYPMQNRFRTGMTLAMFSLVVFTLVVMAFIIDGVGSIYADEEVLSGGFDIRADVGYANPLPDLLAGLDQGGLTREQVLAAGSVAYDSLESRVQGGTSEGGEVLFQGVDAAFSSSTTYGLALRAPEFATDEEVWQALRDRPGTALVSAAMVPSRADYSLGEAQPPFQLQGFFLQDDRMPGGLHLVVEGAEAEDERTVEVLGVLSPLAVYAGQIVVSTDTLQELSGLPVLPQSWFVSLEPGVDVPEAARALERQFLANGLQAEALSEEIRAFSSTTIMINRLMEGFMALGLIVGIAALGVIAARSVVERRQQIGVVRAIGFQRSMVMASFLLESSFIALLGIGLGFALGVALSPQILNTMQEDIEGVKLTVPWGQLILIFAVAYVASLLTIVLPARQASRVYPAEALRYE
jgi:putative ABC transport system permease protein